MITDEELEKGKNAFFKGISRRATKDERQWYREKYPESQMVPVYIVRKWGDSEEECQFFPPTTCHELL